MPDHEYYAKNRDRLIQYQREYYRTHKHILKQTFMKSYEKNKEKQKLVMRKIRALNPNKYKEYTQKSKNDFLEMYGNECACCGESVKEFLTIEHKKGQKGIVRKRRSTKAYRDAIKEYRPDLYEVLCMNCNHSKGCYGYCPHQKKSSKE